MSQYTTVQGHVQYKDQKTYNKVKDSLYLFGFLNEEHHNSVQYDGGEWYKADRAILNPRDFIIYIPWHSYNHFIHIQDVLLGSTGVGPYQGIKDINLVITCTDGDTSGSYYDNKKKEWIHKDFSEIDENVPDSETDAENYSEWEHTCEDHFEKFLRPTPEYVPNSVAYFTEDERTCKPKRKSSPKKTQRISKRR